jgi:hypothetical protein
MHLLWAVAVKFKTMKFQIRLTDKRGCGSFLYFDATEKTKEEMACKTANAYLEKRSETDNFMRGSFFHKSYKPFRTVSVVEYDNEKKTTKRGGIKFKLTLSFFEAKMSSGRKVRNEWYIPAEPVGV